MPRGESARDKIRAFFIANVGKIVTTHELQVVAGISEYARRIRELRDEEGMQIKSHKDLHYLKPNQYILTTTKRVPINERKISVKVRTEVLDRYGSTCCLCGAGAGDRDPINPDSTVRLVIDHILPVSQGGTNEIDNLRVLCTTCNHGKSNIQPPSETALNILARIRKLSKEEKREIFNILKKFLGE